MKRAWPLLLIPILVVWLALPRDSAVTSEAFVPGAGTSGGGSSAASLVTGAPFVPEVLDSGDGQPGPVPSGAVNNTRSGPSGAPKPSGGIGAPAHYWKPGYEPTPQPRIVDGISIAGTASWYRYVPGGAAAGPALRRFLGPHWRGGIVRVCVLLGGRATTNCVVAALNDWCACDTGAEKLIDLDAQLFAALAPLSQGVVTVEVRAIR